MNDLEKKQCSLSGKIIEFQDMVAVIETTQGQRIHWPIRNLPDDCVKGSEILVKIYTKDGEAQEKENIAKSLLNQILDTE